MQHTDLKHQIPKTLNHLANSEDNASELSYTLIPNSRPHTSALQRALRCSPFSPSWWLCTKLGAPWGASLLINSTGHQSMGQKPHWVRLTKGVQESRGVRQRHHECGKLFLYHSCVPSWRPVSHRISNINICRAARHLSFPGWMIPSNMFLPLLTCRGWKPAETTKRTQMSPSLEAQGNELEVRRQWSR